MIELEISGKIIFKNIVSKLLFLLILIQFAASCSSPEERRREEARRYVEKYLFTEDFYKNEKNYEILYENQYTGVIIPEKDAKEFTKWEVRFWTPDKFIVDKAESIVPKFLTKIIHSEKANDYSKRDASEILNILKSYKRQYVGYMEKGKKYLWIHFINGIPAFNGEWKNHPVHIFDGGIVSWRVVYDIEKNEIIDYDVNPRA